MAHQLDEVCIFSYPNKLGVLTTRIKGLFSNSSQQILFSAQPYSFAAFPLFRWFLLKLM